MQKYSVIVYSVLNIGLLLLSCGTVSHSQLESVNEPSQLFELVEQSPPGSPSRRFQQTPNGFFFQPAGLADDFPEDSTTKEKIIEDLSTLQRVGAKYLRFGIGWDGIEERPGEYRWHFWDDLVNLAQKYGIALIPYVCYTPPWLNSDKTNYWRKPPRDLKRFGQFMYVIASRYKGKIRSWELWNEPDNPDYWLGTVEQFAEMVSEGAQQVRRADPDAILVLGGISRERSAFSEALIQKYHLGSEFDVINVHGYYETWNPGRAENYPSMLNNFYNLISETRRGVDLWLAEFGYSNYKLGFSHSSEWSYSVHNYEHTAEFQAVALWRHHILAAASEKLSLSAWYRIHDLPPTEKVIGDDNNKFLGILDTHGTPKPAFYALKLYSQLFDQPVRLVDSHIRIHGPSASQSVVHAFEKANGTWIITGWLRSSLKSEFKEGLGQELDSRSETLSIELPLKETMRNKMKVGVEATFYNLRGKKLSSQKLTEDTHLNSIQLRGDEVFIAEVHPVE